MSSVRYSSYWRWKFTELVQRCINLWNNLTTSDEKKKSKIDVSTNWYITIKHQRLSSIRVIFVNYQTSELQCNYYYYIQGDNIRNAQNFSGIVSITLYRGFSNEILIEVWLCHRKPSWIRVFPLWKMEYLDGCTTTVCYNFKVLRTR